MSSRDLSILMFPLMPYPCDHSFLEEVYTKIFRRKGHKIVWVMRSKEPIRKREIRYWNGTKVYLLPPPMDSAFFIERLWRKILSLSKIPWYFSILRKEKIDIVQVRNSPFYALLVLCMRRYLAIKFVFQRSIPAEDMALFTKRLLGLSRLQILKLILGKKLVCFCMRNADLVLPISDTMKASFLKAGIPEEKVLSMPSGFNIDVEPSEDEICRIKKDLKLEGFHSAIYVGTMNKIRSLEFLLRVFQLVAERIPNVRFMMLGGEKAEAKNKEELKRYARRIGLNSEIIWMDKISRTEVSKYIAAADIGVSPIVPLPFYLVASPTKLVEMMGMGKAVVCNDLPEQKKLIEASGGGICVKYDPKPFAEAIVTLLKEPEKAKKMGARGKTYVLTHRSYQRMADELEDRYYSLISRKRNWNTRKDT